ncbi:MULTISPECIES: YceI family protein [Flectobacillus]|jgi:polyisoprenoid-binding protein YceI|uniref:YceI family protein n=2 Tax=Flectobacillus TaxID=101 RepID=A0ABT6YX84_9BACT|nr:MULTISPECIES: YceI family protein [Flectobacillus]MDI9865838.1 YceI family protein [Flectobacillus longus]MDI9873484.1 YceI family protein [Flectobacillus rivi]
MKAIKFIASLFVSATVLSSAIAGNAPKKAAEGLAVDTKGSKIHWLAKKVTGQHEGFISISNGNLSVAKGKVTGGTFTIDMKSIVCTDITDAGYNQKFISHITTGDFFEVEKFPTATFKITKVAGSNITGDLTLHGITKTITFPATITSAAGKVTATAKIPVDRTDFNIKYGSKKFFESIGDKAIDDVFNLDVTLVAGK